MELVAGLDIGSRTIALVEWDGGQIARSEVVDTGTDSLEYAMSLIDVTGRVVFMTAGTQLPGDATLRSKAKRSDIKLLFLSKLMEVSGEGEVEKVKVHDLDEDEEYELFVDTLIIIG